MFCNIYSKLKNLNITAFRPIDVTNCNNIFKNAKVFEKNADIHDVSKNKKAKKCVLAVDYEVCMSNDEHEMMIEYSEMTAFNFNSKEYLEVRKDFLECKEAAHGFVWFIKNLVNRFKPAEA